jgi:hypothetical protein
VATANLLPEETCKPGTTKCGSTNWGTGITWGGTNYYQTSSSQDDDTQIDQYGLAGMYALMPTPGNGGATSTPQEVLFIVTDGVNDSAGSSPSNGCVGSTNPPGPYYSRHLFCVNQLTNAGTGNDYCTDIKAKGIRIAFLYLRYNGLNPYDGAQPGYTSDVEPWQYPGDSTRTDNNFAGDTDEIEQAAIACASSGLEFTVDTDTDITTAMNGLFQKAVQTAYLAH